MFPTFHVGQNPDKTKNDIAGCSNLAMSFSTFKLFNCYISTSYVAVNIPCEFPHTCVARNILCYFTHYIVFPTQDTV